MVAVKFFELRRFESFENPTSFLLANQLIWIMEPYVLNEGQYREMFGDLDSHSESFYGFQMSKGHRMVLKRKAQAFKKTSRRRAADVEKAQWSECIVLIASWKRLWRILAWRQTLETALHIYRYFLKSSVIKFFSGVSWQGPCFWWNPDCFRRKDSVHAIQAQ